MASLTLDDIKVAAEAKYGSLDISLGDTTCVLVNALRLPKEKRKELSALQDKMDTTEDGEVPASQEDVLADSIRIIAQTPEQAEALLTAVGDDLALLATIFSEYAKGTQAGEASASPS